MDVQVGHSGSHQATTQQISFKPPRPPHNHLNQPWKHTPDGQSVLGYYGATCPQLHDDSQEYHVQKSHGAKTCNSYFNVLIKNNSRIGQRHFCRSNICALNFFLSFFSLNLFFFSFFFFKVTQQSSCSKFSRPQGVHFSTPLHIVKECLIFFLVADTRLYTLPCRSVGRSICPSRF